MEKEKNSHTYEKKSKIKKSDFLINYSCGIDIFTV